MSSCPAVSSALPLPAALVLGGFSRAENGQSFAPTVAKVRRQDRHLRRAMCRVLTWFHVEKKLYGKHMKASFLKPQPGERRAEQWHVPLASFL